LIVPGIMLGSGMPILNAIGSSLLSVGTFGLTTAMNYALSGLVDWTIAALFIAGGLVGGFFGMRAAVHLAANRRMLTSIFAAVIFVVAIYPHRPAALACYIRQNECARSIMAIPVTIPYPLCRTLNRVRAERADGLFCGREPWI
jgi:hypothetical protein